jgi:hypothetical protein
MHDAHRVHEIERFVSHRQRLEVSLHHGDIGKIAEIPCGSLDSLAEVHRENHLAMPGQLTRMPSHAAPAVEHPCLTKRLQLDPVEVVLEVGRP